MRLATAGSLPYRLGAPNAGERISLTMVRIRQMRLATT
jgi:hypothetical protein